MVLDLAGFATIAADYPDRLRKANRVAINRAALAVTNEIRQQIVAATGDSRLSGVGRSGARVGARFDVKGSVNPTAIIRATGPLHLVERPTSAHRIEPRRRRRRGRPGAVVVDGHPYAYVNHPGAHSFRQPWAKGVNAGLPMAVRIFADVQWETLTRAF